MERPAAVVFRDVILLALLGFVAVVILLISFIHPPEDEAAKSPGHISVYIAWPPGATDVDLWVQAPGQLPVGYSNKGGPVFNLLRDDLGTLHDTMPANFEFTYSRGIPVGEYAVNIHLYRNDAAVTPIPVRVEIKAGRHSRSCSC